LQDQSRRDQPTTPLQQAANQGGGDIERRVGHDVIRPPRQPQIGGVGLDDDNRAAEAFSKVAGPLRVGLDCDHASAGGEQRGGQRAAARTDVEDVITAGNAGVSDEPGRPSRVELVPAPARLGPGHGGGP
jgi:hypothetical protein